MNSRQIDAPDVRRVSQWTRQLQIDEGATPMALPATLARLERWLERDYEGLIFEVARGGERLPVGYALFRPTDPDLKEPEGIYLRQFFILPEHRRAGLGTQAFRCFYEEAVGDRRLVLEALTSNPIGQAFWRSLGLTPYAVTFELRPNQTPQPSN